ncbi:ComEA family DNA-binding protein [Moraxella lacunata]|uniref:DNA uptake protein n=1 Tax=Moraxella lacunata TaxID=477 RepID=A0A1V4GWG9_MORLA|nr:helix-hairpin-helix domain-containing protein [Moraxella lacunata]OPH36780.1 DNA uptake protein [Moraxella lacunata]
MNKKEMALELLGEVLNELDKPNGKVAISVQKLSRATELLDEKELLAWTKIQLADPEYILPLQKLFVSVNELQENGVVNLNYENPKVKVILDPIISLNISTKDLNKFYQFKSVESSGGLNSIGFIEQKIDILAKSKKGNDQTYYITNLQEHLEYIKVYTYKIATKLFNQLKFEGTTQSSFDILRIAVDDKLLDINPEIAEQLMIAFKNSTSNNKEELSQVLTTCRRLLEKLADTLYPATDEVINGRTFKPNQYINRLWRFMDINIQSDSNKDLAKAHIDLLGSWLQKSYALTCKGVHSDVSQLETTKTVFHIYLLLADILEFIQPNARQEKISINQASLDELEAVLGVSRKVAKEIIKARVKLGSLSEKGFSEIEGIGSKVLNIAKENFIF